MLNLCITIYSIATTNSVTENDLKNQLPSKYTIEWNINVHDNLLKSKTKSKIYKSLINKIK